MKRRAPILMFVVFVFALLVGRPMAVSAADYDYELQDVMRGGAPGLSAAVYGSGGTYYGQSLSAAFNNATSKTFRIKVPIGLSMVPQDSGVQTMYTAGGEIITVPPGVTRSLVIAFCGEMNDHGPHPSDGFTPGAFATGDLLRTLQRINRENSFGLDAQHAVWYHTDGRPTAGNEAVQNLAGGAGDGGGAGAAAAAGLAASVVAGGAALLLNRTERSTEEPPAPDTDPATATDGGDNGDAEIPDIPPETLPPELRPPIDIAEPPPPEDPADGVKIVSADDEPTFWDTLRRIKSLRDEGSKPIQVPVNLPNLTGQTPPEGETWWEELLRVTGWGQQLSNEDREKLNETLANAGQVAGRNPAFGSASQLSQALSDPAKYAQTGEGDPRELLRQVNREATEEGATTALVAFRRALNLTSLTNAHVTPPNFSPNPASISPGNLKNLLTPVEVTRDLSGIPAIGLDIAFPDAQGMIDKTGIYQKNDLANRARDLFREQNGRSPDPDDPVQYQKWLDIYNRLRGK
jgi:hypothetical protein